MSQNLDNKSNEINGNINLAYINTSEDSIQCAKVDSEEKEFKPRDGGYGWIVLLTVIWSYGIALSIFQNYNLLYPYLIDFYNQTEENNVVYAAWIGSNSFGTTCFLMVVSSILVDFFGPAKISFVGSIIQALGLIGSALLMYSKNLMKLHFLTYGFIVGTGQSFIFSSSFAIIPHWFDKKLGLVMGLINTGACFLIILTSILIGYLLRFFKIEITFYVMAGLSFTSSISLFIFKTQIPRETSKNFKDRFKESLGIDILKKPKFVLWVISTLFGTYGNMIPILTMAHYSNINFVNFKPEILNVIYGISSGLGSIAFGQIVDRFKLSIAYNYILAYFFYGLGTFLILCTTNLYFYCFLNVVFGVFDGLFLASLVPMAIETAESNIYSNQALGYYHSIIVVSILSAPAVTGFLFEKYGDYYIAYTISYGLSFLGVVVLFFYPNLIFHNFYLHIKDRLRKKSNQSKSDGIQNNAEHLEMF